MQYQNQALQGLDEDQENVKMPSDGNKGEAWNISHKWEIIQGCGRARKVPGEDESGALGTECQDQLWVLTRKSALVGCTLIQLFEKAGHHSTSQSKKHHWIQLSDLWLVTLPEKIKINNTNSKRCMHLHAYCLLLSLITKSCKQSPCPSVDE